MVASKAKVVLPTLAILAKQRFWEDLLTYAGGHEGQYATSQEEQIKGLRGKEAACLRACVDLLFGFVD